jgi:hypothetical protein
LFTEGLISAFSATRQTNYVVWGDRSREWPMSGHTHAKCEGLKSATSP